MLRALAPVVMSRMGEPAMTVESPGASHELLAAALERVEHGVCVVDGAGRALYMNASARAMCGSPAGMMPAWLAATLPALRLQLARHESASARVVHDELTLRVQARVLRPGALLLEVAVAIGSAGREVAERLAHGLGLARGEAELLALVWRGLSNEEIAGVLAVRTGTIKSRLFRLYARLGVKRRSAAVLRAQEVLAS